MDQTTRDGLIDAVRRAAREEILPRFRNLSPDAIGMKSGPQDLVTVADTAAERSIAAAARALCPGALIVGEEAVEADPALLDRLATADHAVIIDPIDGTGNFVNGMASFGTILAVTEAGQTVFGLLYDPVGDDWIMATKGQGAWYVRPGQPPRRLTGPRAVPLAEARAFVPLFLYPPDRRAAVAGTLPFFARASDLRCSCHEYRQFALGHAEVIVSPMAKPWDHAAGMLVAAECGGTGWSNGRPGYDPARPLPPIAVAATPDLLEEVLALTPLF
ncbi:inositol monophosphatase family protein [Falsirhodobacter sp. 20TX0035]|uniref:inositol monophosphatase family protein n=1 Tax=Falsirhodobacter sp. 20TX0035 TaxID=3022019 RepID=UPI00232F9296|nr:inositol monophosphatase [Falsirhodobacter sp. 20TX0035]MDB6453734.1 inositol monophosphatase [Falsirhodobacter sp. 20TX0035]